MNLELLALVLFGMTFAAFTVALCGLASTWRENEDLQRENHRLWRENANIWQALTAAGRCLELGQVDAARRALANARTRAASGDRP